MGRSILLESPDSREEAGRGVVVADRLQDVLLGADQLRRLRKQRCTAVVDQQPGCLSY